MNPRLVATTLVLIFAVPAFADDAEQAVLRTVAQLGGRYERGGPGPDKPVVLVSLGNTRVGDANLKELATLGDLESLSLSCTRVTDAGLKELAPLSKLKKLYLGSVNVTDAGLRELTALTNLKELYLGRTKITDAGLKYLRALKKLKTLNVRGTTVTVAGVKALREALPGCDIHAGPLRSEPKPEGSPVCRLPGFKNAPADSLRAQCAAIGKLQDQGRRDEVDRARYPEPTACLIPPVPGKIGVLPPRLGRLVPEPIVPVLDRQQQSVREPVRLGDRRLHDPVRPFPLDDKCPEGHGEVNDPVAPS